MNKSFDNVYVNSTKSSMKLDVDQIIFEPFSKERNSIIIESRLIDHIDWFVLKSYATMHIYTTGKLFYSISELSVNDKEIITKFFIDEFNIGPENISSYSVQYAGQNYGKLDYHEKSFSLSNDGRVVINIPFSKIDQIHATTNDLTLEFDVDEDQEGESLLSIRFQVSTDAEFSAKDLHSELNQRTNLLAGTDNHIAELRDVKFLKPKKNYNLRFCNDLLFMCSKEGNHKIPYSKISMIHRFSIPSDTDKRSEYILISLSRPIRQGQKSYKHLVIETSPSDSVNSEGIDEKTTFIDAFEDLMYRVGEIKFQTTDKYFINVGNEQGSECLYKSSKGFLYMTQDAFVFLHSYIIYIPFKNVKSVKFDKVGKDKKFTLAVTDKNSSVYTFTGIDTYAYVQIDDKEDDEESRIDREQMIKECSYNGLESFYRFIRKHEIKIEERGELKDQLADLKAAISTHDRQSKVHAKERMREQKTEDKLLGVTEIDDDEEEDEDFNPDAENKGGDDDEKDDDDDDEEAEGGDDEEDESDKKGGSNDEKEDSD